MVFNGVYSSLVFNNPVTHPINLHNSILVCIFVILTSRIVFSSFHIFHFCPYLGRGFLFGKYCVYLNKQNKIKMSKKLKAITNTPVRFPFTATALLFLLLDYYQLPGWVIGVASTLVVILYGLIAYVIFNTEYVDIFKEPIEPTVKASSFQEKLEHKLKERNN